MSQPARSHTPETRSPGLVLVEAWADYAKTAGMYPATSQRVADRFEDLLSAIDAAATVDGVTIRMGAEEITVGGEVLPLAEDGRVGWLYDRLHKSALEGVIFAGREAAESLPAFTQRLLQNHSRQESASDEALWPDVYSGLGLIHRRFTGGFNGGGAYTGLPVSLEGQEPAGDDTPEGATLATRLALEGPLVSRVSTIRRRLQSAGLLDRTRPTDQAATEKDLLDQLVTSLPEGQADEYGDVVEIAEGMLDYLDEYLAKSERGVDQLTAGGELKGLLFMASRMFFRGGPVAPDPKEETTPAERATGRAGDEKFTDDVDAFQTELRALPKLQSVNGGLDVDPAELRAESLDVYLGMLVRRRADQPTDNLYATLEHLIGGATQSELALVRRHLHRAWFAMDNGEHRKRAVRFLESTRLTGLLRQLDILTATQIARGFPSDFVAYLDALDQEDESDDRELTGLISSLGSERVLAAAPALVTEMSAAQAHKLLSLDTPAAMAFAPALLRAGDPAAIDIISKRIRKTRPDIPVARLMEFTHDPAHVTNEYLAAVVEVLMGREPSLQLKTHVALCLTSVVDRVGDEEGLDGPRRLDSIRVLGALDVPVSSEFLRTLGRRRKLGVFHAEPRKAREAAAAALARSTADGEAE